ncbi:MAG TPA: GDSL-type esterase/lipase family protein [Bauldia sp.]|nr:GDSL-type esterase/lipase family protein [Bauldia sp.]
MFIYNASCFYMKEDFVPGPLEHRESAPPEYAGGIPDAVFFVGDSITFGWRDEDVGGWPARLSGAIANRHGVTAYNLGVRGDTSRSILARWEDEVGRRKQAHSAIVFAFGANDAKLDARGQSLIAPEETRRNTAAILSGAKRDHAVLLIGPAPVDEAALAKVLNPSGSVPVPSNRQIGIVSDILAEEAERAGIPYFDLMHRLAADEDWFEALRGTDGIHPPGRGHDRIAALVLAWQPWASLFRMDASA